MKAAYKAILRLVFCIAVVTAVLALQETEEPLLACAACINCDLPHNYVGSFSVCMTSIQTPPSTYCTWDCVNNPDGSGLHPANIRCFPDACSVDCWC
jgi:hypothetical protein